MSKRQANYIRDWDLITKIKPDVRLQIGDHGRVFDSRLITEHNPLSVWWSVTQKLSVVDHANVDELECDTIVLNDKPRDELLLRMRCMSPPFATDTQRKQIRRLWESSYIDLRKICHWAVNSQIGFIIGTPLYYDIERIHMCPACALITHRVLKKFVPLFNAYDGSGDIVVNANHEPRPIKTPRHPNIFFKAPPCNFDENEASLH